MDAVKDSFRGRAQLMGMLTFLVPEDLAADDTAELSRACIVGGPDNMPWTSETEAVNSHVTIRRTVDESGYLVAPIRVGPFGRLMFSSATLMERAEPYEMLIELARGKVNQVRSQYQDWTMGGLQTNPALDRAIRDASHAFGAAILAVEPHERRCLADNALQLACRAAEELVNLYVQQVFGIRHQRQAKLDSQLGCRVGIHTRDSHFDALARAGTGASLDFSWRDAEAVEGRPRWDPYEALLQKLTERGLEISGGPLIDFSTGCLPDWLTLYERDAPKVATLMCRHVEAVICRFGTRIRRWELCRGSNHASVLRLNEEDLFWLTIRLTESARAIDPKLDLSIGLVEPWGEYMCNQQCLASPVDFADKLLRTGVHLSRLGLEVVMGVAPQGSYCRDVLDMSRLIDMYAQFGIPLQINIGYPSGAGHDPKADPVLRADKGNWRGAPSPRTQADWITAFAGLALCKPSVSAIQWVHLADDVPHHFPHCGLIDADGATKPAVERLQKLREDHLL
jgi:hypothetical protein